MQSEGRAYDLCEVVPGLCCVAAPIRNGSGEVTAAVSVGMPERQFSVLRWYVAQEISATANRISLKLRAGG